MCFWMYVNCGYGDGFWFSILGVEYEFLMCYVEYVCGFVS